MLAHKQPIAQSRDDIANMELAGWRRCKSDFPISILLVDDLAAMAPSGERGMCRSAAMRLRKNLQRPIDEKTEQS